MIIRINNKIEIKKNQPPLLVAEISSNHCGDLNLAKKLIREASKAGVDAVKFQTFKAKNHYSKFTPGFNYLKSTNTFNLIESLEINREWHPILKNYAEKYDIDFFNRSNILFVKNNRTILLPLLKFKNIISSDIIIYNTLIKN